MSGKKLQPDRIVAGLLINEIVKLNNVSGKKDILKEGK
jgi:hypothetical protein